MPTVCTVATFPNSQQLCLGQTSLGQASCSRVQLYHPLGNHFPNLLGALCREAAFHTTPVPHLLQQPVLALG